MSNDDPTKRVTMSIRLAPELVQRLDAYAQRRGISRNAAIAVLADRALRDEEDRDR